MIQKALIQQKHVEVKTTDGDGGYIYIYMFLFIEATVSDVPLRRGEYLFFFKGL